MRGVRDIPAIAGRVRPDGVSALEGAWSTSSERHFATLHDAVLGAYGPAALAAIDELVLRPFGGRAGTILARAALARAYDHALGTSVSRVAGRSIRMTWTRTRWRRSPRG